jgi:hypothetical protein
MNKSAVGTGILGIAIGLLACSGSHTSTGQPEPADEMAGKAGIGGSSGAAGANSGGSADCSSNQDCSVGVCSAGSCKEVSCVPGTTFCGASGVWTCGPDGTPTQLAQRCSSDQFCLEKSGTATCNATACFAGDPICDGTVATQCKPDGSGPKPGGDDCAAAKQVCYSGQCRDLLCTPGQKLCDNNTLYLCSDAGSSRVVVNNCSTLEVCDPTAGACQTKVCDPGKLGCDSTRVVTCNASGSGYVQTGLDCATKQGVCIQGACQAQACSPSLSYCSGGDVYSCSNDGTVGTLINSCTADSHCVVYGSSAYCAYYSCQPNSVGCSGNVLATCAADGSGWLPGGTDCALTSSTCIGNACSPNVCNPNTLFCKDGNVQQCDGQGLTSYQVQFCTLGTYCATRTGVTTCAPTPCTADTDGCVGEKLGHCSADGMSVGAGATDCGASQQVCTLQGCAKTAVDSLSSTTQIGTGSANELVTNLVAVDSARKLTLIEAYLSMPTTRNLVWVVYVLTNADGMGEFDLEFQKSTSGSGAGYQSSGAISIELEAGKTYAIGVGASDGNFVYYYDLPVAAPSLNFARVTGSADISFGASFDSAPFDVLPSQLPVYSTRLTTTTP